MLRVDAVKTHGLYCQVVSYLGREAPVRPGMRIVHKEYKSEQDEMVLIGLLAMARWRLIELDRQGTQVSTAHFIFSLPYWPYCGCLTRCILSAPMRLSCIH